MDGALQAATALILGLSAAYFFGMVALGIQASRHRAARLGSQATTGYEDPELDLDLAGADPGARHRYHVAYLIPCLDEELVIGDTVRRLPTDARGSTVVVIDDGSEDGTVAAAQDAGADNLVIVRRTLPEARLGKGPALNAGFERVRLLARDRGLDPAQVIVCVMDADGRLSDGALGVVLPLFDDPKVGGAQLAVRIRNRRSWVTRFQDFQFWTMSALTQYGRLRTNTVSLGGNGQFTRLSALLEVGSDPWTPSLTEDLDLSLSLLSRGWRCTTTPHASVDQQGVETIGRLLRQRTRWYQGHMTAARRIPEIWRSSRIGHGSAIEAILYLLVPWVLDLPWSVLYHVALVRLALHLPLQGPGGTADQVIAYLLLYVLAFSPALVSALLCHRRDPAAGWWRAVAMGHSFVLMNYLSWVCCWRALLRMVRGRTGWDKTSRTADPTVPDRAVLLGTSA